MKKSYMLLSLPNTGTTWFTNCLKTVNGIKYYGEFFNPTRNPKVGSLFGSELRRFSKNLARKISSEDYEKLVKETWDVVPFNFTKEVWSPFQLKNHIKLFNCYAFYRDIEFSLPPSSSGRNIWYVALCDSILINEEDLDDDIKQIIKHHAPKTEQEKMVFAYIVSYYKLLKDAKENNVPIIRYDILMNDSIDQIKYHFNRCNFNFMDVDSLVKNIIRSRKPNRSRLHLLECKNYLNEMRGYLNNFIKKKYKYKYF